MCLLPVTISRFITFGGGVVPFWATVLSDFIFNLQGWYHSHIDRLVYSIVSSVAGLVNVVLVLCTRHLIPNTASLPMFTPRKAIDFSTPEAYGITPYIVSRSPESVQDEEKTLPELPGDATTVPDDFTVARLDSRLSQVSTSSVNSETPLVKKSKWTAFLFRRG